MRIVVMTSAFRQRKYLFDSINWWVATSFIGACMHHSSANYIVQTYLSEGHSIRPMAIFVVIPTSINEGLQLWVVTGLNILMISNSSWLASTIARVATNESIHMRLSNVAIASSIRPIQQKRNKRTSYRGLEGLDPQDSISLVYDAHATHLSQNIVHMTVAG